ncbi:MAG: FAD:protein FMN transferase [Proteobacteria bacterium]|nr:FAD:protein FMN transferase [Pseudomonadota bacterium]
MLRRARPLLGTFVEVAVSAKTREMEWQAAIAAFEAVAQVHRLMSFHEPDSDVTRINRCAHTRPVEVDPRTYAVLCRSRLLSRESNGVFDCSVGDRLMALGVLPRTTGLRADGAATWRDVTLLPGNHVRFRRRLTLDLGGIAKGFAVDQAIEALAQRGATAACVNAGGDLRVFGERDWSIAVRRPDAPSGFVALPPLRNRALATSADTFTPNGAIVDPASGLPARSPRSVSVLAPTCTDADALTKVVWLSEHPPLRLLEKLDASAIVLGPATEISEADAAA